MARLLIVHHTPSPTLQEMLEEVRAGATDDAIYYPCLEATARRPYGLFVHGNNDTTGAIRGVESIVTGLQWRPARPPVSVVGPLTSEDRAACWELGATVAATLGGAFD